jgi:disulfide bond formation protein DsbB
MGAIQNNINLIVTTLFLVSNICFAFFLALFFFDKKVRLFTNSFVNKNILFILFAFVISAVIGSLAYSEIAGFPPCELCWIQRIFMYPQAILVGLAMWWHDKKIVDYLLTLSILGAVVAFYHSLVHWGFGAGLLACTAGGGECAKVYVLEYGYITIPFMSFSTFVYLITLSLIYKKSENAGQ